MPLHEAVAFDAPANTSDGYGGHETGWAEVHLSRARFIYAKGSEAVEAARLQGKSTYKVVIPQCAAARALTTDHRMRDVRRGTEYQVREIDSISDRRWVYIVVESGVAQ